MGVQDLDAAPQGEPTFADDIEYLCGKCLGNDYGHRADGHRPRQRRQASRPCRAWPRSSAATRTCATPATFAEAVKHELRVAGRRVHAGRRTAGGSGSSGPCSTTSTRSRRATDRSRRWTVDNRFARQPLQLRIEALMAPARTTRRGNIVLADFGDAGRVHRARRASRAISAELEPLDRAGQGRAPPAAVHGQRTRPTRRPVLGKVGKTFAPPLNLSGTRRWACGSTATARARCSTCSCQPRAPLARHRRPLHPDRLHRLAVLRADRAGRASATPTTPGPTAASTRSTASRSIRQRGDAQPLVTTFRPRKRLPAISAPSARCRALTTCATLLGVGGKKLPSRGY